VSCYGGLFVESFVLCVGNVCGVKGVGCYGVHLLESMYCM
jgi:hypothetical protein